jgi:hypothetical protein
VNEEGRNHAPESDVSKENDERRIFSSKMISPGENFSSTAIRPTEGKDGMQRQSNQTLKLRFRARTSCFKMEKSAIKIS